MGVLVQHLAAGPSAALAEEVAPSLQPWDVFERLAVLPHALFLDSASPYTGLGCYSFLTADPFEWLCARGRRVTVSGERGPRESADPLAVLAERLARFPAEPLPGLPPFQGGAAGLFGYDLCHHLERLPRPRFDEFAVPDLAVGLYDWAVAFDHAAGRCWLIATGLPETDPRRRRRRAARRLAEVRRLLHAAPRLPAPWRSSGPPRQLAPQWPVPGLEPLTSNFDRAGYLAAVRRAVEYVHAGDCFQVNVAQRLLAPLDLPPRELYRRLRERNAAPFAGYFDLGEFVLASASPERFLRVTAGEAGRADEVETRPIKGTRPRGRTPEEDRARAAELLASPKDRAENVMIVDLLRNDLGRVCRFGSVRVPAVCRLETYRTVHHLVSEVRGRLRADMGALDLLRAAFPGGSVTGAPKVRAMEIIAELEPTARGPYCGSLGYLGFDGVMDTNILIRTFTAGRGWVQFPVGGGIVADSEPEREYEETWHKAEGMLRALR
jgi:para-aminobenzoate synthetase component 1